MNARPTFKFNLSNFHNQNYRHIEVAGTSIHQIFNTEVFYAEFGYTEDIKKSGLMPEEFIWAEYIKDGKSHPNCLQMHIVGYLNKHSDLFKQKYGHLYGQWLADHEIEKTEATELCAACKLKKFCSESSTRT
ncbi:MAG: hypothetical protein WCI39_09970 [Gallionellaceae bacterium]